ncbi:uncharacterized protein E0L32_003549 [Thyridium curvatum]|uniref:Prenylated Rab acceptor 1 n=1 Tax=Thyridium curvatum TaxID=1093900 RepID=A0A507BAT0_9PEZI|nr:uncharacterized protein E0L32_003549 [Thyridium curvatum]TPX16987.1 hypothetical protein E0L32_003549 [Thyridium curvatum]
MARINIPIDVLTSRLNLGDRFSGLTSGSLGSRFANIRPLSEFFDLKRVSKPQNFGEVQSRLNYNISYFSSNYAAIFAMLGVYGLLTNWWLLFDIIFVGIGMFVIRKLNGQDLVIGNFRATTSQLWTGILVIAIPVALISSLFSLFAWLIGASGLTILGHAAFMDKPIDEAFSGEADLAGEQQQQDMWGMARRLVEELDSDDTDTQGVGLASATGTRRFVSDPLNFTGIDLGEGPSSTAAAVPRQRASYAHPFSDDEGDSTSEEDSGEDLEDDGELGLAMARDEEEALVESALARIRRAQAKGRKEVKLNKEELAALERRRERMQNEEAQRRRRKEKEQRFAVPISQLEPSSRKQTKKKSSKQASPTNSDDGLPNHPTPGTFRKSTDLENYPPIGYFPPPNASRSRPRSGTAASYRPPSRGHRERSDSPFNYAYVNQQAPGNPRHVSDTTTASRPRSSLGAMPHEERWVPNLGASASAPSVQSSRVQQQPQFDPFQYMTGGPRTPYHAPGVASRRHMSGPPGSQGDPGGYLAPRGYPRADRSGRRVQSMGAADETTSEEEDEDDDDDTTSDELNHGARVRDRPRSREEIEVIEVERSPEPEPEREAAPVKSKKSSNSSSPVKRKPVSGGGGGGSSSRRRKGR